MGEEWIRQVLLGHAVELLNEMPGPLRILEHIGVEPLKEAGPEAGIRVFPPEAPDLSLLEDVVAPEDLVCPFAGQDDFEVALPDHPGEEEEGYGPFTIKQNSLRYWWNRLWDNDPDALMVRRRAAPYRFQPLSGYSALVCWACSVLQGERNWPEKIY